MCKCTCCGRCDVIHYSFTVLPSTDCVTSLNTTHDDLDGRLNVCRLISSLAVPIILLKVMEVRVAS